MQINPYNFRQYLAKTGTEPHISAWLIATVFIAFLAYWIVPYIVPSSVAIDLPKTSSINLKSPPSAFVVYAGNGFIYQNQFYNFTDLVKTLGQLHERKTILIAAASGTTLQEILPLLDKAQAMGFQEVAFTVKP